MTNKTDAALAAELTTYINDNTTGDVSPADIRATLTNSIDSKINNDKISTTTTLGTSDTLVPSQKAVKTYVDTAFGNVHITGSTISGITDANTVITAYVGKKIAIEGVTFDGGVVDGATSITSTGFIGNLTGNATGTAATVTGAAQASITSLGTLTTLTVDNININGSTITGVSDANTVLTAYTGKAIAIEGVSFDGGVVTGATSITSTGFTGNLTGNVTGNATGTAATVTGAAQVAITSLGTLTTLTVDNININGSAITGVSDANTTITAYTGRAIAIEGVSFDGGVVTGATSITSTGFTGNLTGNVTGTAATVTVADTTDTTCNVALFESATGSLGAKTDGGLTYNAGTGVLTATGFSGPLTGNVTGNVTGTAATVTGAAQTNITSVGTLTGLTINATQITVNSYEMTAQFTEYYNKATGSVTNFPLNGYYGTLYVRGLSNSSWDVMATYNIMMPPVGAVYITEISKYRNNSNVAVAGGADRRSVNITLTTDPTQPGLLRVTYLGCDM